jgi:hypothetical protein
MAGKVPGTPKATSDPWAITKPYTDMIENILREIRDRLHGASASSLNEDQHAALLSLYDALAACMGKASTNYLAEKALRHKAD